MQECERAIKTKNGIDIYYYKNPGLHSFGISLFLRAGCMFEGENESGITHFLEHALIRNVNKLEGGQMYSRLDKLGVEFGASTYSEMVQFYVGGSAAHFAFGADIITKLFSPIVLKSDEVDAERRRIKAEIRESDDKNLLSSFTSEIVYGGTSLSRSIVGTNASVDRVTAKRLEEYRRRVMTSGGVFFYVTGNVSDSDISALTECIERYDVPYSPGNENIAPVPSSFGARVCDVYIKNADYTVVRFTFDLDMSRLTVPKTDLLYDMLLSGYSSRMFVEMSEKKGLFYDISGSVERYRNIGTFNFSFELKEKDVYEALDITVGILKSVKSGISEDECTRAGYVDNALMLYDDQREMNFTFAYDNHIMGQGYSTVRERREAYASVSAEDLCRAAGEIFRPENLTLTMKGNKKHIDKERIKEIIRRL